MTKIDLDELIRRLQAEARSYPLRDSLAQIAAEFSERWQTQARASWREVHAQARDDQQRLQHLPPRVPGNAKREI